MTDADVPGQLSTRNPWPGLRSFTEDDREFFFGRERETAELLGLVQRSRVVVLYGQSGLGKTSLLQAGLVPQLKALNFLPLRLRFDHSDGAPPLARQVMNALQAELGRLQIEAPPAAANETLWEYFHRTDVDFWGPRNRLLMPVLILDQFEEIFTLGQRTESAVARVVEFAAELEAVIEHRPPARVRERLNAEPEQASAYALQREGIKFLVSLREDFLPHLDPWRERIPSMLQDRFRLERMTGARALEVVERGGRELVSTAVARDIVDFVSRSQRSNASPSMEQRDVEPALLSVVCEELNSRRIASGKSQITADLLSDEREEIIRTFYERAFDEVDSNVRNWVEDNLLTAAGYRNRAALEDALHKGLKLAAFDRLVNARILHREERGGVVWLELTHDLLSDPAARSRALREQRMQAEEARRRDYEAAERERLLKAELGKSRRRTTVFAILLLGTVAALAAAIFSWNNDLASRKTAQEAERHSQQSFQSVADMTARLSSGIGAGTWIPAATMIHNIDETQKAYEKLLAQTAADRRPGLEHEQAEFLTRAADSLYQIGHYRDGLADAEAALALLDRPGAADTDAARLSLAEAHFEKATGLLAAAQLSAAATSFESAAKLAGAGAGAGAGKSLDFERVWVLSQLGLGNAALMRLQMRDADNRFGAVLEAATKYGLATDEVVAWQIQALQGRGRSQFNAEDSIKHYTVAAQALSRLTAGDPSNPRWKTMAADLAYWHGESLYRLERLRDAKEYFADAERAAKDLCNRDCSSALDAGKAAVNTDVDTENWRWRLLLLQSARGLGQVRTALREWDSALAILRRAEAIAEELNKRQPAWSEAALLHGWVEVNLGEQQKDRYAKDPNAHDNNLEFGFSSEQNLGVAYTQADNHLQEARDILEASTKLAPEDRGFVLALTQATSDQGQLRRAKAEQCRRRNVDLCSMGPKSRKLSPAQMDAAAIQLDREALAKYSEVFDQLQPIKEIGEDSAEVVAREAETFYARAGVLSDLKKTLPALEAYGRAAADYRQLVNLGLVSGSYRNLAMIHIETANGHFDLHQRSAFNSQLNLAIKDIKSALAHGSEDARSGYLGIESQIHHRLADAAFGDRDFPTALAELAQALDVDWQGLLLDFGDEDLNKTLTSERSSDSASLDSLQKALSDPALQSAKTTKDLIDQIKKLRASYDPEKLLDYDKQTAGSIRPLIPGNWRALVQSEADGVRKRVVAEFDKLGSAVFPVKLEDLHGVRKLPLSFYDDAALYELNVESKDTTSVIEFLTRGSEAAVLNGSFAQIRDLNAVTPPRLQSADQALEYLRFVFGMMKVRNGGRIRLIDRVEDIDWLSTASNKDRDRVIGKVKPAILERSRRYDGDWEAIGTLELSARLELVSFYLSRDGNIDVIKESEFSVDPLPVTVDTFSGGMRFKTTQEWLTTHFNERELKNALDKLKKDPDDMSVLKELPDMYSRLKKWPESAAARRDQVAHVLREQFPSDAARKAALSSLYLSLAVDELWARHFPETLAAAENARDNDAEPWAVDRWRAHALFFGGKPEDAKSIYFANVGKKNANGSDWVATIAKDFKDLEEIGIANDESGPIRDELYVRDDRNDLSKNPQDIDAVRRLVSHLMTSNRYVEALDAQRTYIALLTSRPKPGPEQAKSLARADLDLSWLQILTRDFAGALATTDSGLQLDADYLPLTVNRAHALSFLGRTAEAESIYVGNRDKKFDTQDSDTWQKEVIKDFDTLEADGLSNPQFLRIRQLLAAPKPPRAPSIPSALNFNHRKSGEAHYTEG